MSLCTEPKQIGDTRYVFGKDCTWHGLVTLTGERKDGQPCCPRCGGELLEQPSREAFFAAHTAALSERHNADPKQDLYSEAWAWSEGKCFPDFETLEGAFRQHMEGRA